MKDANLSATSCKLWVLIEDPHCPWWKKLNFNSGFLLSEIHRYRKASPPTELSQIVQEISWPMREETVKKPWTLVGCKNHFDADWIFLIHDTSAFNPQDLEKVVEQLQVKNLRCFTPFEPEASLKARLDHCDLVTSSTN